MCIEKRQSNKSTHEVMYGAELDENSERLVAKKIKIHT